MSIFTYLYVFTNVSVEIEISSKNLAKIRKLVKIKIRKFAKMKFYFIHFCVLRFPISYFVHYVHSVFPKNAQKIRTRPVEFHTFIINIEIREIQKLEYNIKIFHNF